MIDTQPSPSTALRSLIIAFCFDIFCVPIASEIVIIELRASGIAATARATANIIASTTGLSLRKYVMRNTPIQIAITAMERILLNLSRLT